MEVRKEVRSADGTMVQVRFGVWRCLICGETFLGAECPSHCAFCGAHAEYLARPDAFAPDVNDVAAALTAADRANLQESAELEARNSAFYDALAKAEGPDDLRATYKRLARIEAEHCGVFCKLLGIKRPKPDAPAPAPLLQGAWAEDIRAALARENAAQDTYARFAAETRHPRLKQVWTALVDVELDHAVLEAAHLSSFPAHQ